MKTYINYQDALLTLRNPKSDKAQIFKAMQIVKEYDKQEQAKIKSKVDETYQVNVKELLTGVNL